MTIGVAIESIDKVGPFQAKFGLSGIDDIRAIKKKVIVDRAKEDRTRVGYKDYQ